MADAPEILSLRSNDRVMQFFDREKMRSIGDAEALIELINESLNNNNGITWAITLIDEPGELIGTIGFWRIIKEHYRTEVGYMHSPDYWGKGMMKEALSAVIHFAFTQIGLHSIEARINPSNAASAGLLETLGFVREAYFREDYHFNGRFLDTTIYSLLQ